MNNAGWTHRNKPMMEVTEEEFERLYDINVRSIFHMNRKVVPIMRSQGGGCHSQHRFGRRHRPRPGLTWYNSTKGRGEHVSKSMAVELAPDRIRVNCVAPVMGATGLLEAFMGVPDTPETGEVHRDDPPRTHVHAEGYRNACLYLASDEAEFITGTVFEVDGGQDDLTPAMGPPLHRPVCDVGTRRLFFAAVPSLTSRAT